MIHKLNDKLILAVSDKTEVVIAKELEFNWYSFGYLHSDGFSVPSDEIEHIITMLEELKNATE